MQNLYEGKLEIGGKGVVIATCLPENAYMIGWVVDIEAVLNNGDLIPDHYFHNNTTGNWCDCEGVLVRHPGLKDAHDWADGYGLFDKKNIMPLSGTFDEEFIKEENPYLSEEVV